MMTLTRRQRTLLLFLSASSFTAWFSGLGDRIEAQDMGRAYGTTLRLPSRPLAPRVAAMIVRDPFEGAYGEPEKSPRAARAARESSVGAIAGDAPQPSRDGAGEVGRSDALVPNIEAEPGAARSDSGQVLLVRATIVGPSPVAYVSNGTQMDIVRVGDSLADRRITKIDLHGIVFNDGTRLDLPDAFLPTPPPRGASRDIRLSVEELRRLFAPRAVPLAASRGEAPATPEPSASPGYPSPGPLPSANTSGLPPGVNPTSNPRDPTPYPYPYPYAPPGRTGSAL